jgi:hypothetical protein
VSDVIGDREQSVPQAWIDVQLGVRQSPQRPLELLDASELITISREQQDRTGDPAPMLDPQVLDMAGPVQWIAQQYEPSRRSLGGDHARNPAPERVPTDDRGGQPGSDLIAQRGHGSLG